MAIIRELITLIRFRIDGQGAAEASILQIKRQLDRTGDSGERAGRRVSSGMREAHEGAAKANEGVMHLRETLKGLMESLAIGLGTHEFIELTNDWAAMSATIKIATASQEEFLASRQRIVDISRTNRVGYEGTSQLFANFKAAQADTKESNEAIFQNIDTITKALAIGHQSAARNMAATRQFDDFLMLGKVQQRHLNSLKIDSPTLARAMERAAGGPEELEKWMKGPKNNLQGIIELLAKMKPLIDADFKALPLTFGNAMQVIRDDMEEVLGKIFVDTGMISDALKPIVGVFDDIVSATDEAATFLGGYKNLAITVADVVLSFLSVAIARTAVWLGELVLIELPWIAAAAAIALVGIGIQDIWVWMHGGDSLMGRYVGSFQSWKPAIDSAIASVRGFIAAFTPSRATILQIISDLYQVWLVIVEVGRQVRNAFVSAFRDPEFRRNLKVILDDLKQIGLIALWLLWTLGRPLAKLAIITQMENLVYVLQTALGLTKELVALAANALTGGLFGGLAGLFRGGSKPPQAPGDDDGAPPQAGSAQSWWRRALGAMGNLAVGAANTTAYGLYTSGDGHRSLYGDVARWAARRRQESGDGSLGLIPRMSPSTVAPQSHNSTIINQHNELGGVHVTAPSDTAGVMATAATSGVTTAFDRISNRSGATRMLGVAPGAEFGTVSA